MDNIDFHFRMGNIPFSVYHGTCAIVLSYDIGNEPFLETFYNAIDAMAYAQKIAMREQELEQEENKRLKKIGEEMALYKDDLLKMFAVKDVDEIRVSRKVNLSIPYVEWVKVVSCNTRINLKCTTLMEEVIYAANYNKFVTKEKSVITRGCCEETEYTFISYK